MENVNIFNIISAIVSLASLASVIILWRKGKWEVKKEEASVAESYEAISERTAKRLEMEIEKSRSLELKVDELSKEVKKLRVYVEEMRTEYESGIAILVRQLESEQIQPAWTPNRKGNSI